MGRLITVALLLVACSAPGTGTNKDASSPADPAAASDERAAKDDEAAGNSEVFEAGSTRVEPTPKTEPPKTKRPSLTVDEAPTMAARCEQQCLQSVMMRAVAAEALEAECRDRCKGFAVRTTDAACTAAARSARKTLERRPMRGRAELFWVELSKAELSCNARDSVLERLAKAARERDPARRTLAMRAEIESDPWLTLTCPAGVEALNKPALRSSIDAIVRECPIADAKPGMPIYDDLDPVTFLAVEVVRTHWTAAGARSSDHDILLDTVLLSTALAND